MKKTVDLRIESEEYLESCTEEFSEHLDTARIIWRRYPSLVEAPEFPKPFKAAFARRNDGVEPGNASFLDEPLVERGILKLETGENRAKTLEDFRAEADAYTPRKEESSDARYAFAASALDPEMDTFEKALLAIFQRILRDGEVCADTPVETLLQDLVLSHGFGRALTQKRIHEEIEGFDKVWEDNVRMVRKFYREHAELVTG